MMRMRTKAMKIDDDHYVVYEPISECTVKHGIYSYDIKSTRFTIAEFNAKYSFVTVEMDGKFANVEEKTDG